MITSLVLGAVFGAGLWAVLAGAFPPRPGLAGVLAALHREPPAAPVITPGAGGWAARLGRPAAGLLSGLGLPRPGVRADLAVLGKPAGQHLAEQAAAAATGLLIGPVMAAVLAVRGARIPLAVPAWAALLLAAAGFAAPSLSARADAGRRRRDFRHALSAFLDLTVISLAGGAGVDAALGDAAATGTGWAFAQIRAALQSARLTRVAPWVTLGRLGAELGIGELAELAQSVSLAGTEGARIRESLAAKAASLRAHQLTDAEGQAAAATERMSMPVVILFLGFLIFIGYPAVAHVMAGL